MNFRFPPALTARLDRSLCLRQRSDGAVAVPGACEPLGQQRQLVRSMQPPADCLPFNKVLAKRGGRLPDRTLVEGRAAAQDLRLHIQCDALLDGNSLAGAHVRQHHLRLAPEQVEDRAVEKRLVKAERMGEPLAEVHAVVDAGERLVRITEQPLEPSPV